MGDELPTESEYLTVREKIITTIIGLPLTYGLGLLCGHLEGVDKSGWIWWISLLGLIFSGAITIGSGCSLVWSLLLSTGIISWTGQVIEWILKTIVYIAFFGFVVSLASSIFDDLHNSNNRELLFFALGGYFVYVYLNRKP